MTVLADAAHEAPDAAPVPSLDEVLWQAWKSLDLPEGYRAEIIEGFIEVSPTGRHSHTLIISRLHTGLGRFLADGGHLVSGTLNIFPGLKVLIPDVAVFPEDHAEHLADNGLGVLPAAVNLVAEVVSPGGDGLIRDRVRKRRSYAQAGIPVYVLIDDYDGHGTVSVLTSPSPEEGVYAAEIRVPYGTEVIIPEGPAKGFVIDESITGPLRD